MWHQTVPIDAEKTEKLKILLQCLENTRSQLMNEFTLQYQCEDFYKLNEFIVKTSKIVKENELMNSERERLQSYQNKIATPISKRVTELKKIKKRVNTSSISTQTSKQKEQACDPSGTDIILETVN
jgi:hypothetical protein